MLVSLEKLLKVTWKGQIYSGSVFLGVGLLCQCKKKWFLTLLWHLGCGEVILCRQVCRRRCREKERKEMFQWQKWWKLYCRYLHLHFFPSFHYPLSFSEPRYKYCFFLELCSSWWDLGVVCMLFVSQCLVFATRSLGRPGRVISTISSVFTTKSLTNTPQNKYPWP